MNFAEVVVHEYLSHVLGFLTLPQMKVNRDGEGYCDADFLALDFTNERILIVEVTASQKFPKWYVDFVKDRTATIERHSRTNVLKGKIPDSYRLVWLLIVLDKHVTELREETSAYHCKVMSLESILEHEKIKKKLAYLKDLWEWALNL